MNEQLEKLYGIARKPSRRIIGLMSGTSLDGLDIALCRVSGSGRTTRLWIEHFKTTPYPLFFKEQINTVFAKSRIDFEMLCGLNALIGLVHARYILEALHEWEVSADAIDLVASHGQTVFHAPQSLTGNKDMPNSTLQIGDGDHISVNTGIITISDFRQKHLAAGGEGAPLAAYGDYLLFADVHETRILLNIGGIANFTYLPAGMDSIFATDVGPGNTLMDQYMHIKFGKPMDRDAQMASSGRVHKELLNVLLDHPFFEQPYPKTTGPELFNMSYLENAQQLSDSLNLEPTDVMATLCAFTAHAISHAVKKVVVPGHRMAIYVSGGGLHNPLLMKSLQEQLPDIQVASFEVLGLLPDAKEAALFALLANETIVGGPGNVAEIGGAQPICMGKISFAR